MIASHLSCVNIYSELNSKDWIDEIQCKQQATTPSTLQTLQVYLSITNYLIVPYIRLPMFRRLPPAMHTNTSRILGYHQRQKSSYLIARTSQSPSNREYALAIFSHPLHARTFPFFVPRLLQRHQLTPSCDFLPRFHCPCIISSQNFAADGPFIQAKITTSNASSGFADPLVASAPGNRQTAASFVCKR